MDPLPLIGSALGSNKKIYLPVLRPRPKRSLWFSEFRPGDRLLANRFGIDEPDIKRRHPISPWGLDLILLPLVAFDDKGNRLGMGGGFYDRTLAYLRNRKYWRKPLLVGMAHECQRLSHIKSQPWDIPLNGIITETGIRFF